MVEILFHLPFPVLFFCHRNCDFLYYWQKCPNLQKHLQPTIFLTFSLHQQKNISGLSWISKQLYRLDDVVVQPSPIIIFFQHLDGLTCQQLLTFFLCICHQLLAMLSRCPIYCHFRLNTVHTSQYHMTSGDLTFDIG